MMRCSPSLRRHQQTDGGCVRLSFCLLLRGDDLRLTSQHNGAATVDHVHSVPWGWCRSGTENAVLIPEITGDTKKEEIYR